MITQNKLLDGLIKRLDDLLDESWEIFEEEHPWLFNDVKPELVFSPRRKQNEIEIAVVFKRIGEALPKPEPVKPVQATQAILLS